MRRPIAYGIDFGTTNSAISVAWDDGSVEVLDPGGGATDAPEGMSAVTPSILYLDRDRVRISGSAAVSRFLVTGGHRTACSSCPLVAWVGGVASTRCNHHRVGGGCNNSRLISGIKGQLADPGFESTHSWAEDFSIEELVSVTLSHLKKTADGLTGSDVRRVVVGHPVVFAEAEGDGYAEKQQLGIDRLVEASRRAGFDVVEVFAEPAAAVMDEVLTDGVIVAVDFGGGTFDCAVMEVEGEKAEVKGLKGVAVGGEMFDAALFEEYFEEPLGLRARGPLGQPVIPNWFRLRMATLSGAKFLLSDDGTLSVIGPGKAADSRMAMVDEILFGGHAYEFYRSIEDLKIALSRARSVQYAFTRPAINLSFTVERADFERRIAGHMKKVFVTLTGLLEASGIDADKVTTVVRTGGSSEIPMFQRRLLEMFPRAEQRATSPFTAVARGMGVFAMEVWADG